MSDLTPERLLEAQRALDAVGPPSVQVRFLTLGENVIQRLMDEGILRYDAESKTYYLPMGVVGFGLHGFSDVPVHVSKTMPDLIFGEYSDGTHFTNFEAAPEADQTNKRLES